MTLRSKGCLSMRSKTCAKAALAATALWLVYSKCTYFAAVGGASSAAAAGGEASFIMSASDDPMRVRTGPAQGPRRGDKQIFFTETTCAVTSQGYDTEKPTLRLDYHQACAIESAARAHPTWRVIVYYSCPLQPSSLARSHELVRRLFALPNVAVWHAPAAALFAASPLAALHASGALRRSFFQRQHASDVVRMLVLAKYGGTYLDLDFVVRRPLDDLAANFATTQNGGMMNGAALRLSADPLGARVAAMCLEDLRTNFRWYLWTHNGPELITRVLRKLCRVDTIEQMTPEACSTFTVYPPGVFYPVQWYERNVVYNEAASEDTMRRVSSAHAVHLWMSLKGWSFKHALVPTSRQPLALLQKQFCPTAHSFSAARRSGAGGSLVLLALAALAAVSR